MFYPGLGRSQALLHRLPAGPVVGAEVGVFEGAMSHELLGREDLTLLMIDTWGSSHRPSFSASADPLARLTSPQWQAVRERAMRRTEFAGTRRIILMADSTSAASCIAPRHLDFVFLDADHSHAGVCADISAWAPRVKDGGWIGGHDYRSPHAWTQGVTQAVDEFASRSGSMVEADQDNTWFIRL